MTDFRNVITEFFSISSDTQTNLINSIVIITVLYLIRRIFKFIINKKIEDTRMNYIWRKSITYTTVVFGIFIVGQIWFRGVTTLATYLGLVSAGLAIALKDLITCMAGWAFILLRRPFWVGDRIQVGDYAGDVIDIRIFKFTLLEIGNWVRADQSTGRIIDVPNSMVFTDIVGSYNKGFPHIWNEIPVLVTFESDWQKAKKLLTNIANKDAEHLTKKAKADIRKAAKKFMIVYKNLAPIVYTSVEDSGVLLTIRYLCDARSRRASEEKMWEDILKEFEKCSDIDFAYPTTRYYNNPAEGKSDTGGLRK
ncbi:MAG: mechanosensitive ion channel family protein [bacterium]|nr:mechanosensitive ion channel family protein [bacterium]